MKRTILERLTLGAFALMVLSACTNDQQSSKGADALPTHLPSAPFRFYLRALAQQTKRTQKSAVSQTNSQLLSWPNGPPPMQLIIAG